MGDALKGQVGVLDRYVPSVACTWDRVSPKERWRMVEGTLVFSDISGFTTLSERLATKGRIGAEELTSVLDRVFGGMLEIVNDRGGSLIKFGGDALLLLFQGEGHPVQACAAAVEMRTALRQASQIPTSVGRVDLKMSSGIHTGQVDFFLVGASHRELIVTGPAASTTTEMEGIAGPSEIVVSDETMGLLPGDFTGPRRGSGWMLRKKTIGLRLTGPSSTDVVTGQDLSDFIPVGLRAHLATGITDSEHRIATVGFVKFTGVDALLAREGPLRVAGELDRLVGDIQAATESERVTFLSTDIDRDGGKVILTTGVPTAHHDDEGRMLRAVRAVLDSERDLTVQIGVNRGHVFAGNVGGRLRSTYTVMGDTVNLAARLMAAARPGMLYASPTVLDLSATLFRTEELEPLVVKGKEHPVQAYAVFDETGVRPPDLRHELPFHGRDAELQAIVGIVTTCARVGHGGMMTISGDTGVGKSRLIAEVLERCPGLATLMIQAEPYGSDNPYWALRDPVRRMLGVEGSGRDELETSLRSRIERMAPGVTWALPLLGDVIHVAIPDNDETRAIDSRFRPARTADVLIELFGTVHTGPFAVVVEDGMWLDAASTELLRKVGETAESRPWTVIVTARHEEADFEAFGEEIHLGALDETAVRAIAVEATAAAPLRQHELDSIVTRAGGNPLFLSEILKVVRDMGSASQIPDSLDAVVSKQIDTLPPLVRQMLRYSSVLGRSFRTDVLNQYLGPDKFQLDRAAKVELDRFLEPDGSARLRFHHAVVHDVAYGGLPYRRRRELHARAGSIIEAMAGDDPDADAELLALHFAESGDHAKAWHYSRVAGDKAKRTYANTEAATHYRRALDAVKYLGGVDQAEVAEVWERLGAVRDLLGQYEEARDALARAARLLDDPVRVAELHLRRAEAWFGSGNLTQAKRSLTIGRRLLDGVKRKHALALLARLDAYESGVHISSGDPNKALTAARRAIEKAQATGEEEARARALSTADWANFMLGRDETRRGEDAIEIFNRLGQLDRSAMTMNMMGAFAYLEGNWDDAVDWYGRSAEAAETSGNTYHVASTRANIAELMVSQRRYHEAIPLLAEAGRFFEASHSEIIKPFVDLQRARALTGLDRPDEAIPELERLFSTQLDAGEGFSWPETALALAEALVRAGRTAEALQRIDEFTISLPESASRLRTGTERIQALAAISDGRPDTGITFAEAGRARAIEEGDLYAEFLLAETLTESRRRAGREPDPTLDSRISELSSLLGVEGEGAIT